MWRALDVLGVLKWPSLVAVLVLPTWFYVDGWRSGWTGEPLAVYSAEAIAGLPLVPMHAAGADPLADRSTAWSLRLCADCPRRVRAVRLGHSHCMKPPHRWTPAHGQDGRLSARIGRSEAAGDGSVCLWVSLDTTDGRTGVQRWPLRASPPPCESTPPRSS